MSLLASSLAPAGRFAQSSQTALNSRPVMPSLSAEARKIASAAPLLQRRAALVALLQRALVEVLADLAPGPAASTSSSRRVLSAPGAIALTSTWQSLQLLGQRLGQAHDGGLGRRRRR